MFKRILFATTASPTCDDAAKVAFDLAQKNDAALYVLHVFGIPTRGASRIITDIRSGEEETADEDYAAWVKEEIKNTYAAQLEGTERAVIDCVVGSPAMEILRKAWKEDIDLIVMGARTRQEDIAYRYRALVGSTMERVARGALCPVLIINHPCATCFGHSHNIVFGTDFSKAAMAAFNFAYRTAKQIGGKLFLFHATGLSDMPCGHARDQENIEQSIAKARQRILELYAPLMEGFDNFENEVWEGVPHIEILKFARQKNASLIVMAHHTHTADPEKALLDSTVEQVALQSACPVASVNRAARVHLPTAKDTKVRAETLH